MFCMLRSTVHIFAVSCLLWSFTRLVLEITKNAVCFEFDEQLGVDTDSVTDR